MKLQHYHDYWNILSQLTGSAIKCHFILPESGVVRRLLLLLAEKMYVE